MDIYIIYNIYLIITSGIKQGDLLSPKLLFLYLLMIFLMVWVDELNIQGLAYADELLVLASSPKSLKRMINNLKEIL